MYRGQQFTALLPILCSLRMGVVHTDGISALNKKQNHVGWFFSFPLPETLQAEEEDAMTKAGEQGD